MLEKLIEIEAEIAKVQNSNDLNELIEMRHEQLVEYQIEIDELEGITDIDGFF